jgi:SAM-dependent methyltransferase
MTAQDKVNQEWDEMAGDWDDMAGPYANAFYEQLWKITDFDPPQSSPELVVDFGCGTGLLAEKLRRVASQVLAVDASPRMVAKVREKVRTRGWDNVEAVAVALGDPSAGADDASARGAVEESEGRADLIVASSVLAFVPEENVQATMEALGRLLKPGGGALVHSDWPSSEKHPDGMTKDKAAEYYGMAGLQTVSTQILTMDMGGGEATEVFFGVAKKP